MVYRLLAYSVITFHVTFVIFVGAGGLLMWRYPRTAWFHLPAVAWGVAIEWSGAVCPLTPLENWLHHRSGQPVYRGDFIDRYVMPFLYPEGLTHETQLGLAVALILLNTVIYALWLLRCRPFGNRCGN